jgi:hypothetical protein
VWNCFPMQSASVELLSFAFSAANSQRHRVVSPCIPSEPGSERLGCVGWDAVRHAIEPDGPPGEARTSAEMGAADRQADRAARRLAEACVAAIAPPEWITGRYLPGILPPSELEPEASRGDNTALSG